MDDKRIEVVDVRGLVFLWLLFVDVMGDEDPHVEALGVLDLLGEFPPSPVEPVEVDLEDPGGGSDRESFIGVLLGVAVFTEVLVVEIENLALAELLDALLEGVVVGDVEGQGEEGLKVIRLVVAGQTSHLGS